jgi:hypothetical protein
MSDLSAYADHKKESKPKPGKGSRKYRPVFDNMVSDNDGRMWAYVCDYHAGDQGIMELDDARVSSMCGISGCRMYAELVARLSDLEDR